MKAKKINIGIRSVIAAAFLLITILHPRIPFGLLFLISFIQCISLVVSKKEQESKRLWRNIILEILCSMIFVWITAPFLNLLYPYHAPYKKDIRNLKAERPQDYVQFPDEIPDSATHIKWVCVPSLMQGSGYHELFFNADASYIKATYSRYRSSAALYIYEDGAWVNKKKGKAVSSHIGVVFPHRSERM